MNLDEFIAQQPEAFHRALANTGMFPEGLRVSRWTRSVTGRFTLDDGVTVMHTNATVQAWANAYDCVSTEVRVKEWGEEFHRTHRSWRSVTVDADVTEDRWWPRPNYFDPPPTVQSVFTFESRGPIPAAKVDELTDALAANLEQAASKRRTK